MTIGKKRFSNLYLVFLALTIYSPNLQVFDRMAIQNLLISSVNFLALISIPFVFNIKDFTKQVKHPIFLIYCGYLFFALLSMTKSINIVESFVRLGQLLNFAISLLIIIFISKQKLVKMNTVLIIILVSILLDMFFSLINYVPFVTNGIPYQYDQNTKLVGIHGNRNILATVLFFKIPFVVILASRLKKSYVSIIAFIITTIAFFNISLLSSRATYLAIIICSIILIFSYVFSYVKKLKIKSYGMLLYFLPLFIAYFMSTNAIDSADQGDVINRVSTITSTDDTSKNTRLRYYSHSIEHTLKNPFLGGGIGNWKILSIKYDAENIENYVIPYNAHNDILEASAETGVIGGLFFLASFLIIFYYLINMLKKNLYSENNFFYFMLVLPFIIYFIDLNLNFPSSRPVNLVFYLLYISIIITSKNDMDEKQ